MKILIIGEGAREQALAHKLSASDLVEKIYISPGNGGTHMMNKCTNIPKDSHETLKDFALNADIDFTVVGPEADLMEGIVDVFQAAGLMILGPHKQAAILEGSKSFAKDFMIRHGIKTASYQVFTDPLEAKSYARECSYPLVIKADGLASGKGVEILSDFSEAARTIDDFMLKEKFKDASKKIVIEEYLTGKEASIIALYDGERIIPLNSSMDHKKIGEGERGLNTGGMGSITPNPYFTRSLELDFRKNILEKTRKGLKEENLSFKGVIFFGLMLTEQGSYLLEYNLRFGDPETQSLLETLDSDLCQIIAKTLQGDLYEDDIRYAHETAVCVVLSAKGYPLIYEKDIDVTSLLESENPKVRILSYASRLENGCVLSGSGRVLSVVSRGDKDEALENLQGFLDEVDNENLYWRGDIGRV